MKLETRVEWSGNKEFVEFPITYKMVCLKFDLCTPTSAPYRSKFALTLFILLYERAICARCYGRLKYSRIACSPDDMAYNVL